MRGKNGQKKLAKKCQKEPKFVFQARAPLPACWPEGPAAGAPEAPRLPAEGRQASNKYFDCFIDVISPVQIIIISIVSLMLSPVQIIIISIVSLM